MRTVNEQIKDVENGLECCLKQEGSCIEHGCKYYTDDLKVDCCAELCKDAVLLIDNLAAMGKPAEGLWIYCPEDEHRPRWRCSCCGKIVHRDPAKKLYFSHCGRRNRKEA